MRPFGFRDCPLWSSDDVEHCKRGYSVKSHLKAEFGRMRQLLRPFLEKVLKIVDEGRCVVSGIHAAAFAWGCPELRARMQAGVLPVAYYPCQWFLKERASYRLLAEAAGNVSGHPSFFATQEAFVAAVKSAITSVKSSTLKEQWLSLTPEARQAWRAAMKQGKAAMTPEARQAWRAAMKRGKAAMTPEARQAWRARVEATKAAMTPEWKEHRLATFLASFRGRTAAEKEASRAKRLATLAALSPEQKTAWRRKQSATLSAWSPQRFADRNAKREATLAAKQPEELAAWYAACQAKKRKTWQARTSEEKEAYSARCRARLWGNLSAEERQKKQQNLAPKTEEEKKARTQKVMAAFAKKTQDERLAINQKMSDVKHDRKKQRMTEDLEKFQDPNTPDDEMVRIAKTSFGRIRGPSSSAKASEVERELHQAVLRIVPSIMARRTAAAGRPVPGGEDERVCRLRRLIWEAIPKKHA
jgi:hypothetical protein